MSTDKIVQVPQEFLRVQAPILLEIDVKFAKPFSSEMNLALRIYYGRMVLCSYGPTKSANPLWNHTLEFDTHTPRLYDIEISKHANLPVPNPISPTGAVTHVQLSLPKLLSEGAVEFNVSDGPDAGMVLPNLQVTYAVLKSGSVPRVLPPVPEVLEDKFPTLTNLRRAINALSTLRTGRIELIRTIPETLWVFLVSLWNNLRVQLPRLVDANRKNERETRINPLLLQDNAPEDLLVHVRDTLEYLCSISAKLPSTESTKSTVARLTGNLLRSVLKATALIWSWAHSYITASYASVTRAMIGQPETFESVQTELFQYRICLIRSIEANDEEPLMLGPDALEFVFGKAYAEALQGNALTHRPYVSLMSALRGNLAQDAYTRALEELNKHTDEGEVQQRDALRRLIIHIAQGSGAFPAILDIPFDECTKDLENARTPPAPVGDGSYGEIYRGTYHKHGQTKQTVAIKILRGTGDVSLLRQRMFLELSCWLLGHERIIRLYGVTNKYEAPGLVFDWAENGNGMNYIRELLENPRKVQVPIVSLSNQWIRDIADGLKFIHNEGIIHGDIKAANILIHADNRAVLADFGLSLFARGHPGNYDSARLGSLRWCAPELQNEGQTRTTFESDMFAFGMLCLELYTGKIPYFELANDPQVVALITQGIPPVNVPPSRPADPARTPMAQGLWQLMCECWSLEPGRRPSARAAAARLEESATFQ